MLDLIFFAAIALVLFWTFWSGFSDASNAITTVVATRALKPWQAVALASIGNLIGMFFGVAVATTVGTGVVKSGMVSPFLVITALLGGMVWEIATYRRGIPISETQVLVGTVMGAAIAAAGVGVVEWESVAFKILVPMALAPVIAFVSVLAFTWVLLRAVKGIPTRTLNGPFRRLQLLSCGFFSIAHGANDGQKSAGIIAAMMIFYGLGTGGDVVPMWLLALTFLALSLGTLFGGWKIVQTMGFKMARLQPWQGFAGETSAALIVGGASVLGFPLSTSQTVAGSIIGVSVARGGRTVNMHVIREILLGWAFTIPVSIALGFISYSLLSRIAGMA